MSERDEEWDKLVKAAVPTNTREPKPATASEVRCDCHCHHSPADVGHDECTDTEIAALREEVKKAEEDFRAFRATATELEQASAGYFRRMNAAEARVAKLEKATIPGLLRIIGDAADGMRAESPKKKT